MGFYSGRILPHLLNFAMNNRELVPYRRRIVGEARGEVLEVGIGSGLNLRFYQASVERIIGLDLQPEFIRMARARAARVGREIEILAGSAEAIPLPDASVDTVLMTWALCSIDDAAHALREMRRVLRPGGQLLFAEHGLAPEPHVQRWQRRLTPLWRPISGGCRLDRPITDLIRAGGFRLKDFSAEYLRGPKVMTYLYAGRAGLG